LQQIRMFSRFRFEMHITLCRVYSKGEVAGVSTDLTDDLYESNVHGSPSVINLQKIIDFSGR